MRRLVSMVASAAIAITAVAVVRGQSKTIMGDIVTVTATVEAIDQATRTLTVKDKLGNFVPIIVPDTMQRFSEIKVGDTISARYYDNVVIRLKPPGEPAVDTSAAAITPGTKLAATNAKQRTITATITAIDQKIPSITFKGENVDWNYSSRVADREALAKVKVGDRVDITWTEAAMVSIVAPK